MNAPDQPYVLREERDGVVSLTLNRGERFNPLSTGMILALLEAFRSIADQASIRVVVLAGMGRGFCAGHDLKEMQPPPGLPCYLWDRSLLPRSVVP